MSKYFKQLAGLSIKPPNLDTPQAGTVPVSTTVPVSIAVPLPIENREHNEVGTSCFSSAKILAIPVSGTVPPSTKKLTLQRVNPVIKAGTVPVYESVPVTITVPDDNPISFVSKPRTRVFRATRVEHAHTPGERLVLQSLWTNAVGSDKERTIRIGYDRLAALSGFNWKTARSCLRSLEDKLAIETLQSEDPNSRIGRLYRIYGFEAILERRRVAGLEWVQKGRGVEFVRAGTVPVNGSVPSSTTAPDIGTVTPPLTGTVAVPSSRTLLRSKKNQKESSSNVAVIRAFIEQTLAPMDEDAAHKLLEDCKSRAGEQPVTAEEIIGIVRMKSRAAKQASNPIGFLLTAVPKSFPILTKAPESNPQENPVEDFEYWRELLSNPDATASQLSYAQKLLADHS